MKEVAENEKDRGDKNILIVRHGLNIRSMIDMYSDNINPGLDIDNGIVIKFISKD